MKVSDKYSSKDVRAVATLFNELTSAVLKITGVIALTGMMITLYPPATITASLGLITLVTLGMVGVAALLSKSRGILTSGIKGLKSISTSVLMLTATISLMSTILTVFDKRTVEQSVMLILLLTASMVGVARLLSANRRSIMRGIEGIKSLTVSVMLITGAIGLMALLVSTFDTQDIMMGLGIVMTTVGAMVGFTYILSKMDKKDLDRATHTIMVLTGVLTAVSVISLLVFPKIADNSEDIIKGAGVVGLIMGGLIGMTYLLSKFNTEKIKQANHTMITLTGILVIVALTANLLLVPLGEQLKPAVKGASVVLGVIGIMTLMVWGLSKRGHKDLKWGVVALTTLTAMFVIISLTTKLLLIPIGEQWKEAAKGGVVVMSIIGIMTGVLYALSKIDNGDIKKGVVSLVAITSVFIGITLITDKYLIPIGKQWKDAAKGGTVILGIVAGMGAIIVAVNKFLKENNIKKSVIALGAMTGMLAAVSLLTQKYLVPIGKVGRDALAGAALVEGIIAGLGIIAIGISKGLAKIPYSQLLKGGAVIAGMATLLMFISKTLKPYIQVSKMAANSKMDILVGGGMIAGILGAWGLVIAGVGALVANPIAAVVMAVGGATILGIAGIITAISSALTKYVRLSSLLMKEKANISGSKAVLKSTLSGFKDIVVEVGKLTSFKDGFNMAFGAATITAISGIMNALSKGMMPFIMTIAMIRKHNITQATVKQFKDIVIGGKTGLYDSLKEIIDKLSDIGLISAFKASIISKNLNPIFDTIAKFFEVIKNASNLNYVSEWDKNGNPVAYKSITMQMLKAAATTVSRAFEEFVKALGNGMKAMEGVSVMTLFWFSRSISPIMNSIATFTDSILKVLTASIPYAWDKEGKPIKFRKFQPAEFKRAAIVITDAFATFLETMTPRLKNISGIAGMVVL